MSRKSYPHLTDSQIQWLVEAAARRPDASVDDLIDSFLVIYPDRREHDALTTDQIREKLTSRFNDVLYRKERGYAEKIAEKRTEAPKAFTTEFAVLNPVSRMNFYEQVLTDENAKTSDKFKAINEAVKLNNHLQQEEERQAEEKREHHRQNLQLEAMLGEKREMLEWTVTQSQIHTFVSTLPPQLQSQIREEETHSDCIPLAEIASDRLRDAGLHDEEQRLRDILDDTTFQRKISEMSPMAVVSLHWMFYELQEHTKKQSKPANIKWVERLIDDFSQQYPIDSNLSPMESHFLNIDRCNANTPLGIKLFNLKDFLPPF